MNEPVNVVPYAFKVPEAQLYADLNVVRHDMLAVLEIVDAWRRGDRSESLEQECRWVAAVIKYIRPFGSGRLRWDAAKAIEAMPAEVRGMHVRISDLRGGYIAHSVGEMEESVPTALVATGQQSGSDSFRGVSIASQRFVGAGSNDIDSLDSLARWVIEYIRPRIAAEHTKLEDLAKSMGAAKLKEAGFWQGELDDSKPRKARKPF